MKKLFCALVSTGIILSTSAFALKANDPSECPSMATVAQHTAFDFPIPFEDNVWGFTEIDGFEHQQNPWHAFFIVQLDNVKDEHDALVQGKKYFQEHVTLANPQIKDEICVYALNEGRHAFVAVEDLDNYKIKAFSHKIR